MLDTSNSTTVIAPSWQPDPIATIGRKDRAHLRVVSINSPGKYVVVEVYVGEVLHSSCYLRTDTMKGYVVTHAVRHPTKAAFVDVRATVRRLLSPRRFNTLLNTQQSAGPIDMLRCGVAVGGATFFMREYANGAIVAVFDDGRRQTQTRATVADWNALIDAWEAEDANHGDARRVRIAQSFFTARGWIPEGVWIFGNEPRGSD